MSLWAVDKLEELHQIFHDLMFVQRRVFPDEFVPGNATLQKFPGQVMCLSEVQG